MSPAAQRVLLTLALYVVGMSLVVAATSGLTGRGFWETAGNLWIPLAIFLVVSLSIAYRGDGFGEN